MQEAAVPNLVRTILWIVAIYFILKFLARLFFPIVVRKVAEKAEQQFRQQYQNQHDQTYQNQSKSDKPKETKKVGEYIDYEEVD